MSLLTWCSLFLCNNLTMHCARTGSLELLMLEKTNKINKSVKAPYSGSFGFRIRGRKQSQSK